MKIEETDKKEVTDVAGNKKWEDDWDKLGPKCTTNPSEAETEINYMLKPFIYYSVQYKDERYNNYDFIVNYSLDNYMTVYGTKFNNRDSGVGTFTTDFATNEFTKSGYLIDLNKLELSGDILVKLLSKKNRGANDSDISGPDDLSSKEDIKNANKNPGTGTNTSHNTVRYLAVDINSDQAYNFINYYTYGEKERYDGTGDFADKTYYANKVTNNNNSSVRTTTGDEIIKDTLEINNLTKSSDGNEYKDYLLYNQRDYEEVTVKYDEILIEDDGAKEYYIKAYFFSKWVSNNLKDVPASSAQQLKDAGNKQYYSDFSNDNIYIFNITDSQNNPESDFSWFAEHKKEVIKNSIQYNLNLSISTYNFSNYFTNDEVEVGIGYTLPVLHNQDWENILNNVCMVAFMQGLPCGLSTFNSYSVVKSNNNNTSASLANMYFTQKIGKTEKSIYPYHKIDCPKLGSEQPETGDDVYEGDQGAEFKYDAKKINVKIKSMTNPAIECFYDSEENKYYRYVIIDPENPSTDISNLRVGPQIDPNDTAEINRLSKLPLGNDVVYLYDHENEGCYDCIISGKYRPAITMYDGKLYKIFITNSEEAIIDVGTTSSHKWLYATGESYENIPAGTDIIAQTIDDGKHRYLISDNEFEKRKKTIYTELARIRNSLYKTNSYLNR